MDSDRINALVEEATALSTATPFTLRDFLFKEQYDFVTDSARFATAVCSTRAGKTTACAADLLNTARMRPGTTGIYVTLTRVNAKRIVWPELHNINRIFQLGGDPNEADLCFRFPQHGSQIYLAGANTAKEIEKIRGLSNVALAYIDESQLMRAYIKELIEDILTKRLYDTNGRLRLIGTPGAIPAGYFYEVSSKETDIKYSKWSHHAWTMHRNFWLERKSGKTVAQLIQEDCELKGVTIDDPSIQRECFGRWVLDSDSLLLQFEPTHNHFDAPPNAAFTYILGMDFGFEDADAYAVLGWAHGSPNTYLVEEQVKEKQTYEQMVETFDAILKKYPVCKVVADPGGGGKKLIESLRPRYLIPMEPADKQAKIANYGLLNNALRTRRFFAKKDSRFAQDCLILEKDRDKSTPERTVVKGHSDIVDAVLYAFKESPAYAYRPPMEEPKKGTPAWNQAQQDTMRQRLYEQVKAEQEAEKDPDHDILEYFKYDG